MNSNKKILKICVVTGGRADYGLLYCLMKEIALDPELTLQVVVTGMHLSPEFGNTYEDIIKDGFTIDEKVEMLLSSDTTVGIAKSVGLGVIGFADTYKRLSPDIVVILGDRFEMLAATQAAFLSLIPVAHISGGEITEGVIDDSIRHSITKFSSLHFTATDVYRQRVIQLGEQPETVYNVGEIGLDNMKRLTLLSRSELKENLDVKLRKRVFLVTYHPETLNVKNVRKNCKCLLSALDHLEDATLIFTKTNADMSGRIINQMISDYTSANPETTLFYDSLGSLRYFSALKTADAVIGNSSSGIVEAPSLGTPTINIGIRQKGRLMADSILSVGYDKQKIIEAIDKVVASDYSENSAGLKNPYEGKHTSKNVKDIIKNSGIKTVQKRFYDL